MPLFMMFIFLTLCCHLLTLPVFIKDSNPAIKARKLVPHGLSMESYVFFIASIGAFFLLNSQCFHTTS